MNKWDELKILIDADLSWPVHYSLDRNYEKGVLMRIKDRMEYLEDKEAKDIKNHTQIMAVKEEGFLFTGIPTFDQKEWDKMLKNLEGLS